MFGLGRIFGLFQRHAIAQFLRHFRAGCFCFLPQAQSLFNLLIRFAQLAQIVFPGAFCRDLRLLLGLFELGLKLPGLIERLARFFGIPRESRPFDLQFRVHALFGCETRPVGLVSQFAGLF